MKTIKKIKPKKVTNEKETIESLGGGPKCGPIG